MKRGGLFMKEYLKNMSNRLKEKFIFYLHDNRGENYMDYGIPEFIKQHEVEIGKIKYIVKSLFFAEAKDTAEEKLKKLAQREAEKN
jgi:uncharacterized protein with ATP-grasp and redox domains